MSRLLLRTIAIIALFVTVLYLTNITLNQSGAPVDLEITIKVDYDGTTTGSTTLKYHWVSNSLSQELTTETIDWEERTVYAEGLTSNTIESSIKAQLETATQSFASITINEDGYWSASFSILIGGSLPVHLTFSGRDFIISDVSVSCDVNMMPPGLISALNDLGVTNLDIVAGWKLIISGYFIGDWFKNLFEIMLEGIQTVTEEGSEILGSLNIL